jgi:hypothetical protein
MKLRIPQGIERAIGGKPGQTAETRTNAARIPEDRRPSPWLTASHTLDMVFHMKTTLNIDDRVMARLKRESVRTGRTMSELVETALRRLLETKRGASELSPLPSFNSEGALVDIADREALYRAMEGR